MTTRTGRQLGFSKYGGFDARRVWQIRTDEMAKLILKDDSLFAVSLK